MRRRKIQKLMEVWQIVELRDGCIYKTRYTGKDEWVDAGKEFSAPEGLQYVNKSTSYDGETIRSVLDDEPLTKGE